MSIRIRVTQTDTEESREFVFPDEGPEFVAHMITVLPDLVISREVDPRSFASITGNGTFGYVGPAVEIRRVADK